jgi:hypothetical protein
MLTGDFDRGWQKLEWGWETEQLRNAKRTFSQPLWLGSDAIAGKTVLLHGVHGFGDTIQFCRYVPRVVEQGARAIFEVQEPLHELMGTLPGAAQIVSRGASLPDFDLHCPLLSLPLAFGTRLATIPSQTPYLRASPQQGRSDFVHFGEELENYADTAALIANLDLVISVDTSVAHLAGALAKPVWILLPFMPDWRWLLDREDSPWYPTARLFRQDETRGWDTVMARVHAALDDDLRWREY